MAREVPVGVLLPLRLETRFHPGKLFVRLIPDEPWFTAHDPTVSTGELDALSRYLNPGAGAGAGPDAWRQLVAAVGGPRAVYLVQTFTTVDAGGKRTLRPPTTAEQRTEPALPRIGQFPAQLQMWLARGGAAPVLAATLSVDQARLLADFPDPDQANDRRWWEDWTEAKAAGLAVELDLPGDPSDIDVLYVSGLGDATPAVLLADQRAEGKLGLIAPGVPTNTVDGAPAASLPKDPDSWLAVLQGQPGATEQLVSQVLTGDPIALGALPGGAESHRAMSAALVAGLWPALWGHAADDVWAVTAGRVDPGAAAWAASAMFPEGPFPTVRFGAQPYGLLPATALASWVPDPDDPGLQAALVGPLRGLRGHYLAAATTRGNAVGATQDVLLDLIGQLPTSNYFRHRLAWPLELWWLGFGLVDGKRTWPTVDRAWTTRYAVAAQELQLAPVRRYGARNAAGRVTLPPVVPPGLPDGTDVASVLLTLVDLAQSSPALFANTSQLEQTGLQLAANSLLLRLVIRSLQVAIGDVGRELAGQGKALPESIIRLPTAPGRLETWIRSVTPDSLQSGTPAALRFGDVISSIKAITGIDTERLARLLSATVDCAAFRIDAWLVALPTNRLDALLAAGEAVPKLGAYGWVDAPRPGTPGPTPAGLLHAPSPAQTLTAAVLRDRAINDPTATRWDLDLTSASVRAADRLAEQVRVGAHLGEVMGREVERVVARLADVEALRARFPLRTEHEGRRTCDGLAVLAADQSTLGLDADRLAGLAELRTALDAYGDLLVAEAVHHVTEGRADVAGAVLAAASGLSRPPELKLLQTTRSGRALSTSVLLVLPDVAEPAATANASPSMLADAAAASLLETQLGGPEAWTFDIATATGSQTVTLADLGLRPADALALTLTDLTRLAATVTSAGTAPTVIAPITGGTASQLYERAQRLLGLLGRRPATPDYFAEQPDAPIDLGPMTADLARRYGLVRTALTALVDQLAAAADPGAQDTALQLAIKWGVAPQAPDDSADPRTRCVARALDLLGQRLASGPVNASGLAASGLVDALVALVSPTGQLAITSRLPAGQLPALASTADLDAEWLTVVAAVRDRLATLEAHQLAASTGANAGVAFTAWSNKAADPWQQDATDGRRLVVAYAAAGLALGTGAPASSDPASIDPANMVALAAVDRFAEVVPGEQQSTGAAFGFDAPASRAPQAILLAVPPDTNAGLSPDTLVQIIAETRDMARARMARPGDLSDQLHGLLPSALLPASGATAIPLTITTVGSSG
jgi:hypothetical protein